MKLTVEGMTCGHCVRAITRAIHGLDKNAAVNVDLAGCTVTIDGDIDSATAKAAIESEGYVVTSVAADASTPAPTTSAGGCCGTCHA